MIAASAKSADLAGRKKAQKTLADCHLAPMFGYFSQAEEGAKMVASYPKLAQWCAQLQDWQNFCDTEPKIGVAGALVA